MLSSPFEDTSILDVVVVTCGKSVAGVSTTPDVAGLSVLDSSGPLIVVVISLVLAERVDVSVVVWKQVVRAVNDVVIVTNSEIVVSTIESDVLELAAVPIADEVPSEGKEVSGTSIVMVTISVHPYPALYPYESIWATTCWDLEFLSA